MSFAVFSEEFYLSHYPDIRSAVNAGVFRSGLEHFQQFGLSEGRTLVSPFYDEQFYSNQNPDIADAVANRTFSSGLQHFIQFGETEGRAPSALFNETWYRRRYPDIAAALSAGTLQSGLQHYILFGQTEGRSATPFNEFGYKDANPDVAAAITAGVFDSGLDHYLEFGQFEGRTGIFSGTDDSDTITGFGQIDELYGIDLSPGPCAIGGTVVGGECLNANSLGVNEADVLIGGAGADTFVLGTTYPGRIGVSAVRFYVGDGNADFASIQNFQIEQDKIRLPGSSDNYRFEVENGNLNIFLTQRGAFDPLPVPDLVAIVSGVTELSDRNLDFLSISFG